MSLRKAGVELTAKGEAEYVAGLKRAERQLRLMNQEAKLAVAQLGNNAKITDTYKAKINALNRQMEVSDVKSKSFRERQKELAQAQQEVVEKSEKMAEAIKASAQRTEDLKRKLDEAKQSSTSNAQSVKEAEQAYKESAKETKQLESGMKDLSRAYNANSKELEELPFKLAKAETATQNLRNEAEKLHKEYRDNGGRLADAAKMAKELGGKLENAGEKMKSAGDFATTRLTLPIVAGFGSAIKVSTEYNDQLKTMKSLLRDQIPNAEELKTKIEQLGRSSQQMAADYGVSGNEIRNAMNELIKKGFNFNQVMGTMPKIIEASIASGDPFVTVMESSTSIIEQFGLKVNDTNQMLENATRVTSALTYTANATSSGYSDLGEAMQNVGPLAHANNQQLEDIAATLGILSNAGIKGGEAGTYLMNAISDLATPTDKASKAIEEIGVEIYNSEGKMRRFPDILQDIEKATKNMTDEEKNAALTRIFSTRALKGINPLLNQGAEAVNNLAGEMSNAAKYQKDLAESMGEGPQRSMDKFRESTRVLGETFGTKLLPKFIPLVDKATELVNKLAQMDDATLENIATWGIWIAAAGPVVSVLGSITKGTGSVINGVGDIIKWFGKITTPKGLGDTVGALDGITGAAANAGGASALFANPWTIAAAAVVAAVGGIGYLIYQEMTKDSRAHEEAVKETKGKYQEWFDAVTQGAKDAAEAQKETQQATEKTGESYEQTANRIKSQNKAIQDSFEAMWKTSESKQVNGNLGNYGFSGQTKESGLSPMLRAYGLTDENLNEIKAKMSEIDTLMRNNMTQIANAMAEGNGITNSIASATITSNKAVVDAVIENNKKLMESERTKIDAQHQVNITAAGKNQELINEYNNQYQQDIDNLENAYAKKSQIISETGRQINQIVANAAKENRNLTAEETAEIVRLYMDMAEKSGQSMTQMKDAKKIVGDSLKQLNVDASVHMLSMAGVIDSSTASSIESMRNQKDKTNELIDALRRYNNTGVPAKSISVRDEATPVVNNAQANIFGLRGKTVSIGAEASGFWSVMNSITSSWFGAKVRIGAHATGGNISFPAFANGAANVPRGYTGIVGEAGPELFQVSKSGVRITPLSTREKMRGISGAIGQNKAEEVHVHFDFTGTVITKEADEDRLIEKIKIALNRGARESQMLRGMPS